MASYAGSPALSPEARDKVLQTFRHTLSLAQSGKADEALLGCDFILKMDGRFAPARALLDALRTAPPGAPVDVNRFSEFLGFDNAVEDIPSLAGAAAVAAPPAAPAAAPARADAFPAAAPASPNRASTTSSSATKPARPRRPRGPRRPVRRPRSDSP
jgi:hypothetical protein